MPELVIELLRINDAECSVDLNLVIQSAEEIALSYQKTSK